MTTVRDLLLARATDDRPALLAGAHTWTWAEYVDQAHRRSAGWHAALAPRRPPHVGVLMENGPEFALQLAAAGLGHHVLVGLNTTRRGPALADDIARADVQALVVDDAGRELLADVDLRDIPVHDADRVPLGDPGTLPDTVPAPDSLFQLVFTSGTGGSPKAVRVTHAKITTPGAYLRERLGLDGDDVHYIAMPLFHSNAVMAGWAPALVSGAAFAVARFSATGFLDDVRRHGATYANYVGKPLSYVLATPARPDDADNPLRLVFGNEAGDRDTAAFAERFGCRVVDGFGSTENAVIVSRTPDTPPGSLGQPFPGVAVLDPDTGRECPRAVHDATGAVTNLDECVGELVNTRGAGQFAGYYNDPEATAERMRGGMYWSGDLAYRDAAGWVHFAGRSDDWLRVDGENMAAAPIERILLRHPALREAAVYAVQDPAGGDLLVAALVVGSELEPAEWSAFLSAQPDLSPQAWPRVVRILPALPRTATNKVLKRSLRAQPVEDAPTVWHRDARGSTYR